MSTAPIDPEAEARLAISREMCDRADALLNADADASSGPPLDCRELLGHCLRSATLTLEHALALPADDPHGAECFLEAGAWCVATIRTAGRLPAPSLPDDAVPVPELLRSFTMCIQILVDRRLPRG
jgi:hypothetical protein